MLKTHTHTQQTNKQTKKRKKNQPSVVVRALSENNQKKCPTGFCWNKNQSFAEVQYKSFSSTTKQKNFINLLSASNCIYISRTSITIVLDLLY